MARGITGSWALAGLLVALCFAQQGWAQSRPCGCYCGKWLPAPCSDQACKAACGWQPPSSGGLPGGASPSIDYEAERRAKEEAERQREEVERREQERIRAEKQRQFERERDAAAGLLKGGAAKSGAFGLKQADPSASELRQPSSRVDRDITGRQAAWKQLHCAASILVPAFKALESQGNAGPDFTEFRYLSNEALNALNGQRLGVQCAAASEMVQISGRAPPDLGRAIEAQKVLIERANAAVTRLEQARRARTPDEERIARVYAQQQANQEALDRQVAPIREQQRQINRERERRPDPAALQLARQEVDARRDLEAMAQVAKKVTEGDQQVVEEMIELVVQKPRSRRPGETR